MQQLNLPSYIFSTKETGGLLNIFDPIRKKYVALSPEEWVRQHLIQYLINDRNFPESLLAVEMPIKLNQLKKRIDIAAFNRSGQALMLIECKAPSVKITQKVIDQVARYNLIMKAPYLVVSNGLQHMSFALDFNQDSFTPLSGIPSFSDIVSSI